MSRIFLSHSSRDNFHAVAVRDWLASQGWDEVFLDLDPDRGIAAGERWERALHQAAQRCEAVIFLVSPNWLASGWCRKEYELARGLNKQLFGVLIDGSQTIDDLPPELNGTWQVVDLVAGLDAELFRASLPGAHEERHVTFGRTGLRRLKRGLEKAGLDPKFFAWPPANEPERAPYRGLKPLQAQDAGIFFGRDAPIVEATDRLRGLGAGAPPRILVILGASGAGKSSFLRAGLLPRLARDDRHFIALPVVRPGREALFGENGLLGALTAVQPRQSRAEIRAAIRNGAAAVRPVLAELARQAFARSLEDGASARPPAIVIAVDQAEELFRAEGAEEGAALLAILRDLAAADDPVVIVVFAIRSDAYDALEHAKPLEGAPQAAVPLLPLPRGAYKEVIEAPARRHAEAGARLWIEPQLSERLLHDIEAGGGSDALPLLAFTLEQLFLEYRKGGKLRLADYTAFGGLGGAIDAAVERAFVRADADPRIPRERSAREALLRRGFIPWLAGIDPDTKSPRRNIARRSDIPLEAAPLIDLLVEERLLSLDTQTRDADGKPTGATTIEPTHEALLRQWGLLDGWLTQDFGLLAALEALQRAARDWDANERADAWLAHQGERLAAAQALDARPDIASRLDATDRSYMARCRLREDAARAEAERRRLEREEEQARRVRDAWRLAQRTRVGLAVAVLLTLVAAALGLFAWRQSTVAVANAQDATLQRRNAEDAQGKAAAERIAAEREHGAAIEARKQAAARASEAKRNLTGALAALSQVRVMQSPAQATKLALAAWPRTVDDRSTPALDITLMALGAAVSDLHERRVLRIQGKGAEKAAFSPDGLRIVITQFDTIATLWDATTGKRIAVLGGHADRINSAVFSPDGRRIVTASDDNTARLWDGATGEFIAVMQGHTAPINGAAFSRDGRRIVTAANDDTARLWDAANGRPGIVLQGHAAAVSCAVFSPDDTRVLTGSYDKTARVWDAATGVSIATLQGHTATITGAAYSPDGTRIVTAADGDDPRVWDGHTGKQVAALPGSGGRVAFSRDGARFVTSSPYSDTTRLWDTTTVTIVAVLKGAVNPGASFSPDGRRIVTGATDKVGRLWDAMTGRPLSVLRGHTDWIESSAFSPDGARIVTASRDGTVRLWDAASDDPIAVLRGHAAAIKSAAFSRDGRRLVTAAGDNTARLWDAATGKQVGVLLGHTSAVNRAAFSPDGTRVVTASDDNTARLWEVPTAKAVTVLQGHVGPVKSAVFSPDGKRVATASDDSTARLWDATTGTLVAVLDEILVESAAFSPDATRMLTVAPSSSQTAELHDAATGKRIAILEGRGAAFSPDGTRVVTTLEDGGVRIWDAATGSPLAILRGHTDRIFQVKFSPDGGRIVTTSDDRTARLWDAATGKLVAVLAGHSSGVFSGSFSLDGGRIVSASNDGTARLWDGATGKLITVMLGHTGAVNGAEFSRDGTRIVTGSQDGTARLWDGASGAPIAVLRGHPSEVSATFSPDGRRIVTSALDDGVARLWDVDRIPKGDIFHIACAWLPDHDLTDLAREYGLTDLKPICLGDPPSPGSTQP